MNQVVINSTGVVVVGLESVVVHPWGPGLKLRRFTEGVLTVIALDSGDKEIWRQEFASEDAHLHGPVWQQLRDSLVSGGALAVDHVRSGCSAPRSLDQSRAGVRGLKDRLRGVFSAKCGKRVLKGATWVLGICAVLLVLLMALAWVAPKPSQAVHAGAAAASGERASQRDFLSAAERRTLAAGLQSSGVIVGRSESSGRRMVVLFEDPMCSNCREITKNLAKMKPEYGYTVVPIGMMTEESKRLAAIALCSSEPGKEWESVMQGAVQTGKPCERGLKLVEANNKLFLDLDFSETPMLIAPDGRVAKGAAESEAIERWLDLSFTMGASND